MKQLSMLQQQQQTRRSNSFRGVPSPLDSSADGGGIKSSPTSIFWLVLHGLCCLVSLVLGFRFSRIVFFLLFSNQPSNFYTTPFKLPENVAGSLLAQTKLPTDSRPVDIELPAGNKTAAASSRVVVGRHGILIRPWPHPDPVEVMKAHLLIERVQTEQRLQYGVRNPRTVIVVTPTYVRTFQTLHLTGVMHSLMNVPYDVLWILVEAGGATNETAELIGKSGLSTIHIGFHERMPVSWVDRHKLESRMRVHALRVVREKRLDGIVLFADDSNMHSMELFDEIQNVKWIGAVSVGFLVHSGNSDEELSVVQRTENQENFPVPIQGPACNSSDQLIGWHSFDSMPYVGYSARYIGDRAIVLPRKLEWAGFVLNSRLLWKGAENKPNWIMDLDMVARDNEDIGSPLSLLKDPSVVEPLGSCGRKVLLWWLRVEARADSKFPAGWIIDPPLEVTVPAISTPWPEAPPELPSVENVIPVPEIPEKHATRTRLSRSKRSTRSKRKHEARNVDRLVSAGHSGDK